MEDRPGQFPATMGSGDRHEMMNRHDAAVLRHSIGTVLVLSWLGFAATVVLRPDPGTYNAWLDVGVYNIPFATAVLACLARATRDPLRRDAWRSLAAGFTLFIGGNCYGSLVVGDRDIYPSPADAMWLSFYVVVYVAIILFVRVGATEFHASTWLDGAIAGIGAAALVVAFALGPVLAETDGSLSVVATNLSYPTAEILLIIFVIAAGTAQRSRAASWWLIAGGLCVFIIGDVIYLFAEAAGTYREGGLLDVTWPLGAVFIGLAACARTEPAPQPSGVRQRFVVPSLFAASSVGLLVYGQHQRLPVVAVVLAVAAVVAAAARTALTVKEVKALSESRREARTDELTELSNRRSFIELVDVSIATAEPHAVMILDLDGFKEINDSLGHDVGDDLLCRVGRRLAAVFPTGGLARLGGDEFGSVTPVRSADEAIALATQALATFEEPFRLDEAAVQIGASIGVALFPLHGDHRSELLRFADVAMYDAKRTRTGIALYDAERDPNTADRLMFLDELRNAIRQRRLELHYQPIIDVTTGCVHGIEALVRWRRLDGSLTYPDQFIPEVERAGLMFDLTRAVLDQAIGFHRSLRDSQPTLMLNVNVSGLDLLDDDLPHHVGALLDAHGLAARQLTLEITETAVVGDIERARGRISALRQLGVRIAIDDFGVGYSSMSQLFDLTVDELKIDKSFVTHLDLDHRMEAIVRSTIELARALDLNVVAEGVENGGALDTLRDLRCHTAQGYHIARPLDPDQLTAFLAARTPVIAGDAAREQRLDGHGDGELAGAGAVAPSLRPRVRPQ
jgi:diguanylate cyclase